MTYTPGKTGVARLRAAEPTDTDAVQAVWDSSYAVDDASWARGGWSVAAWASDLRVLEADGRLVGVVAIRAERAADGAMAARVALDKAARGVPSHASALVEGAMDLARGAGAELVRLFMSSRAHWLQAAAGQAGFATVRTVSHMLMPGHVPTPVSQLPPELTLRTMRDDEDQAVLDALNRNWADTWNFVEIPYEMLQDDLLGQREGMLLAVDAADRIVATCHAVYEPSETNPDGNPRAWISNVTVDPGYRQRGIARAMLAAGIGHLRSRGASSITLGVDADNPAPFRLYKSVGFEVVSSQEAWDKRLT